jgi:hypothetical protein
MFLSALPLLATVSFANPNLEDVLPGARPEGMGSAYTSIADDPQGIPYNPAALSGLKDLQIGMSLERLYGPPAPLAGVYLGYGRPLTEWPNGSKTAPGTAMGAAFYAQRQTGVANKDTLLLNYASRLQVDALPSPVRWGASTRFVSFDTGGSSKLGFGVDAGAQLDGPAGLRFGAALTELMVANISVLDTPSFAVGADRLWNDWLLTAVDYRTRPGRSTINPGLEFKLLSGLLKLRTGVGLDWAGVDQFAFGLGVDYSPLLLDFAFTVPPEGLNRDSGSYQVALMYRFGAAPFYGRFIGDASAAAAKLKTEIQDLTNQRMLLEQDIARDQASKTVLQTDLSSLQSRVDETRVEAKELDSQVTERKNAPPPPAPLPPVASSKTSWPRKYVVEEGDTLRSIAGKYYGDPAGWEAIYKANSDKMERGMPKVGAEIVIPAPKQ